MTPTEPREDKIMGQIEQHTLEPWTVNDFEVSTSEGFPIAQVEHNDGFVTDEQARADARRIVACVNLLAGSPDWDLARFSDAGANPIREVDELSAQVTLVQARLDALLAASEAAYDWLSQCEPGSHQAELAEDLRAAISSSFLAAKGVRS
jgi:hypothetical protein